jgi:hypothetical protein
VSASIPIAPGPIIEDIGDHKEVGEAHDQRRRGIGGIGRVRCRVLGRSEAVMGSGPVKPRSSRLGAVVIVVVVAAVGGLAVWRAIRGDLPSEAEKAAQIERLKATVLPVIEDLQVEYFMDVHGCANLTYPRGDFIDGDPEDCGGSTGRSVQFDDVGRADHQLIKAALAASGTPIERVGGTFLSDGRVRYAWFMSTHGAPFATSWALEYDPEGTRAPGPAGMVTLTPVEGEQDWWFACCAD